MNNPRRTKSVKVYSPDGGEETHSWANARDLVRNCGWSLSKPQPQPEKPRRGRPPKTAEVNPDKPNYPDRDKPLERMTRTELMALARSEFEVELDQNRKTEYMVWMIQQLQTGLSADEVHRKMCAEYGEGWGAPAYVGGESGSPSSVQQEARVEK